jgi:pilus assembly protein Flp/PilA
MLKMVKNLVKDERGQGMTEYGLVLGVIGIGAIVALVALREQISTLLTNIKEKIFDNTPEITG